MRLETKRKTLSLKYGKNISLSLNRSKIQFTLDRACASYEGFVTLILTQVFKLQGRFIKISFVLA